MKQNLPVTGVEQSFSNRANILSTTNLKGQITYINKDFVDISGFTKDELLGQNHHIVRHPDMPPPVFKMFWSDLRAEKSWMGIVKNRCKNGDHYWVDAYATPIKKNGTVQEYQSVRRKAQPIHIERAKQVYEAINKGRTPKGIKDSLSLQTRLLGAIFLPAIIPLISYLMMASSLWMLLACLFSLAVSAVLIISLIAPLHVALKKVRQHTDDKVARYVYTGRSDEAGSILLTLKKLESENAALIGRINDMSDTLSDNAANLSSAVTQSEAGSKHQFEQTEQVAEAIEQLSVSIGSVAENARETSSASSRGLSTATTGKQVMDDNSSAISGLKAQINSASKVINDVSKGSSDIERILDVILGIADQTNLLALNAAIEAARAGEQGRGFAVVADEVRSLATRTQESTKEIRAVIEALQGDVKKAVDAMDAGEKMAQDSVEKSEETAAYLDEILKVINAVSTMSDQIAQAVDEQSEVVDSIGDSVTQIKTSSQDNLNAAKLSSEVTDKTVNITRRLDQLTNQFWESQAS